MIPLSASAAATVGPNGTARVELIVPQGQAWDIRTVTVQCTSSTPMPIASVYVDDVTPSRLVSATYTGALDTDSAFGQVLSAGRSIICVWDPAEVGATCTLNVFGQQV